MGYLTYKCFVFLTDSQPDKAKKYQKKRGCVVGHCVFKQAAFLFRRKNAKDLRLHYISKGANGYLHHSYREMSRNKNSNRGLVGN